MDGTDFQTHQYTHGIIRKKIIKNVYVLHKTKSRGCTAGRIIPLD
jgi:hypothetical protein